MAKIPFREHYFALHDYEFVLATRKFYPQLSHVVIIAILLGLFALAGAWGKGYSPLMCAIVTVGVAVASLGALPLLYLWRSGQLGAENYLLGNISSVMGHVKWPPIWQNVLTDRAITFDWANVRSAVLRPAPSIIAESNVNLELNLKNGKQRILRVPRLTQSAVDALTEVLDVISRRRGFTFSWGSPLHPL